MLHHYPKQWAAGPEAAAAGWLRPAAAAAVVQRSRRCCCRRRRCRSCMGAGQLVAYLRLQPAASICSLGLDTFRSVSAGGAAALWTVPAASAAVLLNQSSTTTHPIHPNTETSPSLRSAWMRRRRTWRWSSATTAGVSLPDCCVRAYNTSRIRPRQQLRSPSLLLTSFDLTCRACLCFLPLAAACCLLTPWPLRPVAYSRPPQPSCLLWRSPSCCTRPRWSQAAASSLHQSGACPSRVSGRLWLPLHVCICGFEGWGESWQPHRFRLGLGHAHQG